MTIAERSAICLSPGAPVREAQRRAQAEGLISGWGVGMGRVWGGVMEGDETGSEEGVKDEGRRTEELFKQKQRGEFPQSPSLSPSHLPVLEHQNSGASRVQMLLRPLCVAMVLTKSPFPPPCLVLGFLGFFCYCKEPNLNNSNFISR